MHVWFFPSGTGVGIRSKDPSSVQPFRSEQLLCRLYCLKLEEFIFLHNVDFWLFFMSAHDEFCINTLMIFMASIIYSEEIVSHDTYKGQFYSSPHSN